MSFRDDAWPCVPVLPRYHHRQHLLLMEPLPSPYSLRLSRNTGIRTITSKVPTPSTVAWESYLPPFESDREATARTSTRDLIEETKKLHALWRSGGAKRRKRADSFSFQSKKLKDKRCRKENGAKQHCADKRRSLPKAEQKPSTLELPDIDSEQVKDEWNECMTQNTFVPEMPDVNLKTQNTFAAEMSHVNLKMVKTQWDDGLLQSKFDLLPLTEPERQIHLSSELHMRAAEDVAEFIGSSSEEDFSDEDYDSDSVLANEAEVVVVPMCNNKKNREDEALDFFLELFEKNKGLRKLYEEQCNAGKFECLVCSSIAGKPIKKFNGLVSVVMHASTIQRTKKRAEHRGFGRAVRALLGWDLDKTPIMPADKSIHHRACLPADDKTLITAAFKGRSSAGDDLEEEKSSKVSTFVDHKLKCHKGTKNHEGQTINSGYEEHEDFGEEKTMGELSRVSDLEEERISEVTVSHKFIGDKGSGKCEALIIYDGWKENEEVGEEKVRVEISKADHGDGREGHSENGKKSTDNGDNEGKAEKGNESDKVDNAEDERG